MILDVAVQMGLELTGAAGLACALRLCAHPECHDGRRPGRLRRAAGTPAGRFGLWMVFSLVSSIVTVNLIG